MAVTGPIVILVSPALRRVYQRPALIAFTCFRPARLHGLLDLLGAHLMGFTFVTGCLPCLRLLPTPPHGNAVTGHFPLNDVIGGDVVFIRGLWFLGARRKWAPFWRKFGAQRVPGMLRARLGAPSRAGASAQLRAPRTRGKAGNRSNRRHQKARRFGRAVEQNGALVLSREPSAKHR
jgi:hypothetical protein